MKEQIAQLLAALVSYPSSEGRSDDKHKVIAFAAHWLEQNNVEFTVHTNEQCPALIGEVKGTGDPILFLAHLDVVPANDHLFEMRREGDMVYGRGVMDDKGPAAILMHLLAEVNTWEKRPSVKVLFATDEEIGSNDGLQHLLEKDLIGPLRAVVALDGGSEDKVVTAEKGLMHAYLRAGGTPVHNSRPWLGDNAIDKVFRVYQRMKEAIEKQSTDERHWHETVSIGTIKGGEFVNQVPGSAEAMVDVRFTDTYNLTTMRAAIEACLEPGVTMSCHNDGECFKTDEEHPLLKTYLKTMSREDMQVKTAAEHGATEARFFISYNIPIWVHAPRGGAYHTDDEWFDLASAERVYIGLKKFCEEIA